MRKAANDAALAIYGYAREELVGLPLSALSADPEAKVHRRKDGFMLVIEAHHSTASLAGREVGVSVIRGGPALEPEGNEALGALTTLKPGTTPY